MTIVLIFLPFLLTFLAFYGPPVSNFSILQMEESLKIFPIVCNQFWYNLFVRDSEEAISPFCRDRR